VFWVLPEASEPGPDDIVDGLAGWKRRRGRR
jgi:hypothetical protein